MILAAGLGDCFFQVLKGDLSNNQLYSLAIERMFRIPCVTVEQQLDANNSNLRSMVRKLIYYNPSVTNGITRISSRLFNDDTGLLQLILLKLTTVREVNTPDWRIALGDIPSQWLSDLSLHVHSLLNLDALVANKERADALLSLKELGLHGYIDYSEDHAYLRISSISKKLVILNIRGIIEGEDVKTIHKSCPNLRKLGLDKRHRKHWTHSLAIPGEWVVDRSWLENTDQFTLTVSTFLDAIQPIQDGLLDNITGLVMMNCSGAEEIHKEFLSCWNLVYLRLENWPQFTTADFHKNLYCVFLRRLALVNTGASNGKLVFHLTAQRYQLEMLELRVDNGGDIIAPVLLQYLTWKGNTKLKVLVVDGHPLNNSLFSQPWACLNVLEYLSLRRTQITLKGLENLARYRNNYTTEELPYLDVHLTAEMGHLGRIYELDPQMVVYNSEPLSELQRELGFPED
jgi:hypothetical protein